MRALARRGMAGIRVHSAPARRRRGWCGRRLRVARRSIASISAQGDAWAAGVVDPAESPSLGNVEPSFIWSGEALGVIIDGRIDTLAFDRGTGALATSDRIAVTGQGRVGQRGVPAEIDDDPWTALVAEIVAPAGRIVGSTNGVAQFETPLGPLVGRNPRGLDASLARIHRKIASCMRSTAPHPDPSCPCCSIDDRASGSPRGRIHWILFFDFSLQPVPPASRAERRQC